MPLLHQRESARCAFCLWSHCSRRRPNSSFLFWHCNRHSQSGSSNNGCVARRTDQATNECLCTHGSLATTHRILFFIFVSVLLFLLIFPMCFYDDAFIAQIILVVAYNICTSHQTLDIWYTWLAWDVTKKTDNHKGKFLVRKIINVFWRQQWCWDLLLVLATWLERLCLLLNTMVLRAETHHDRTKTHWLNLRICYDADWHKKPPTFFIARN